jgi:hypothetical protein
LADPLNVNSLNIKGRVMKGLKGAAGLSLCPRHDVVGTTLETCECFEYLHVLH